MLVWMKFRFALANAMPTRHASEAFGESDMTRERHSPIFGSQYRSVIRSPLPSASLRPTRRPLLKIDVINLTAQPHTEKAIKSAERPSGCNGPSPDDVQ